MTGDEEKIAELRAIVAAVRERSLHNGQNGKPLTQDECAVRPITVPTPDLMAMVHARDAAQAKIAAIGNVNPRAGGLLNKVVQAGKKTIARSLQWFVRDQVVFNREMVAALEASIEALGEQGRIIQSLTSQMNARLDAVEGVSIEAKELRDVRDHWSAWRAEWEHKLALNEVQFLRSVADLQAAFQHRSMIAESTFRETVQAQHRDYLVVLTQHNDEIQKRLWADLEKVREVYEKMIHSELRLIRLRAGVQPASSDAGVPAAAPVSGAVPAPAPAVSAALDYGRFAERFRGTPEEIRKSQEFYVPIFRGRENVLDIGCGRGEILELMRENDIPAQGIDLSPESVEQCRQKGLKAETADLFVWLAAQPDGEFDGIISSQVIEHIAPDRVPEMIRLCGQKLRRGGILALETPNPECLAIFATYFYLDPTHTRPMPSQYVQFCMEEAGFAGVEIHTLAPAIDTMPELASLPEDFRKRFFGGLDYAAIARKI